MQEFALVVIALLGLILGNSAYPPVLTVTALCGDDFKVVSCTAQP